MYEYIILVIVIFLILLLSSAIKIMAEYQRIVIFRLGRLQGIKGPGLVFIIPPGSCFYYTYYR